MKNAGLLYFWGRGTTVPSRVQRRAAIRIIREKGLSAHPKEIVPYIRFSPITTTSLPWRHRVEIREVSPEALLVKREEGRVRTVSLISENISSEGKPAQDIHLVLGDLKGFGKLNKIYGKKIVDWLKAEVFRIIDEKSRQVGFMYTIYGDEIGITTRPGVTRQEIEAFLNSIPAKLEAELSRYGVARLKQSLVEDERVKVLGGYFGVDLMVLDAQGKDLKQALKEITESAELYDPDFNGARIWAPRIQFATQSINEFLDHEKASAADPAELYQKMMRRLNSALKPAKEKMKKPQIETILEAEGKEKVEQAAHRIKETSKRKPSEVSERMFRHGEKVVIGKIRVHSYWHRDLKFSSFKELNDHFGSKIGDEVIQTLACALNENFPHLAREPVPPDEFIFIADASEKIANIGRLAEAAQALVSKLSELRVAFEVSLVSSEQVSGKEELLATLDKISRAKENVARTIFPSGNQIKTFYKNLAEELDREIMELERDAAREAEAELLQKK